MSSSEYSQITESQERMFIFDFYVTGSINMTIAVLILYSLCAKNKKLQSEDKVNKYHRYAVKCGMMLAIGLFLTSSIKLFIMNDLVVPMGAFITNSIDLSSIIDSILVAIWFITQLSFYYAVTFIYLSMFNKDKIDIYLKVLMIFVCIGTFCFMILFLVDDLLVSSLKEISVTAKRGIYFAIAVNEDFSPSIMIVSSIAICTDFIYCGVLLYRFITNAKQCNNQFDGMKGFVLLLTSSAVWFVILIVAAIPSDIRFLTDNVLLLTDNICLFLMFKENEELYNNFCGCLCGGCCGKCCFGSSYQPFSTRDADDDNDESRVLNI